MRCLAALIILACAAGGAYAQEKSTKMSAPNSSNPEPRRGRLPPVGAA